MLAQNGALADIIAAGARILECACGPCIGMGQSPAIRRRIACAPSTATSEGRSGTQDAQIYPRIPGGRGRVRTDRRAAPTPRTLGRRCRRSTMPEHFTINDNMIVQPGRESG